MTSMEVSELTSPTARDPLSTFHEQLDAFNAHNLDLFVGTYAVNAVIYGLGDEALSGRDNIRDFYASRFDDKSLRCSVEQAFVIEDRFVFAHELVWRAEIPTTTVATFDIVDGLIHRAMLMKA